MREFETRDITSRHYYSRHARRLKAGKAKEISSNFKQASEYFRSAAEADFLVRPLLQYYGVLALSRGITLFLDAENRETSLQPRHGLQILCWGQKLSGGLVNVGSLTTKLTKGAFHDLLLATENRFYFRQTSSAVNWSVDFAVKTPREDSEFTFLEIAARIPYTSQQYTAWTGTPFPSIYLHSLEIDRDNKRCSYSVPIASKVKIDSVFPASKFPNRTVTENGHYLVVSCNLENMPFLAQSRGLPFIGTVVLYSPLESGHYFSPLATCFMLSFTLGMLCRYFPTTWVNLVRSEKGDSVYPLVISLLDWIQDTYPAMIVDILRGPYGFEK